MILIRNIKLKLNTDFDNLQNLIAEITKIKKDKIIDAKLHKRSIDARKKNDVHYNCAFVIKVIDEKQILKHLKKFDASYYYPEKYSYPTVQSKIRPVIVGFGPAGMFAALYLARAGLKPIVLERGKDVESRKADVDEFFAGGKLNENSNIQFGEGGAGTFSDGKLNTGIKDKRISEVLTTFHQHGASEDILYDAKPHIGTDVLVKVVKSIREEIISLGGSVLFEHKLKKINEQNNILKSITVTEGCREFDIDCECLLLAIGHSARDTFEMLKELKIEMQPKAFAIGLRIEHKQKMINESQYGEFADSLGAADYKLSCHLNNGRGVFSFCMCPGGVVVNASSESGGVATNGMSYKNRDSANANSAILVGIDVTDYYTGDILDGIRFQRKIEQSAFNEGCGYPVTQTLSDYKQNIITQKYKSVEPTILPEPHYGDINNIFPEYINSSIKQAIDIFETKIKGFSDNDAILTAPETRSSSPIRIVRNSDGESSIRGIFPCGEGAGYAGGITSAAVDGLKAAENIINKITATKL